MKLYIRMILGLVGLLLTPLPAQATDLYQLTYEKLRQVSQTFFPQEADWKRAPPAQLHCVSTAQTLPKEVLRLYLQGHTDTLITLMAPCEPQLKGPPLSEWSILKLQILAQIAPSWMATEIEKIFTTSALPVQLLALRLLLLEGETALYHRLLPLLARPELITNVDLWYRARVYKLVPSTSLVEFGQMTLLPLLQPLPVAYDIGISDLITILALRPNSTERDERVTRLIPSLSSLWPIWYPALYNFLFTRDDFYFLDTSYNLFLKFAHPNSLLPTERNLYTYSEIEQDLCQQNSLTRAPNEQAIFSQIQTLFAAGTLSARVASNHIKTQITSYSRYHEVLTFLADLELVQSNTLQAKELFWQAHQRCPYYNRANRGLEISNSYIYHRQIPVSDPPVTPFLHSPLTLSTDGLKLIWNDIDNFIISPAHITPQHQALLLRTLELFHLHLPKMIEKKLKLGLKFVYQKNSDLVDLQNLRDQRVGGQNYPGDNRLWDDVRGVGGRTVIIERDELILSLAQQRNIVGHEVGHQIYTHLYPAEIKLCVKKIYEQYLRMPPAQGPNFYTIKNEDEFFAQNIEAMTRELIWEHNTNLTLIPPDPTFKAFLQQVLTTPVEHLRSLACPISF